MGEGIITRNDIYSALRANNATLTIQPIYNHVVRLQQATGDPDISAKAVAKFLVQHTVNYAERVNPKNQGGDWVRKDEAIFFLAGLECLVQEFKAEPDKSVVESMLITPQQAAARIISNQPPTLSMFWEALSKLYSSSGEYRTSNDRHRDLGTYLIQALATVHNTHPTISTYVLPIQEFGKQHDLSRLRLEMRRANRTIVDATPKKKSQSSEVRYSDEEE